MSKSEIQKSVVFAARRWIGTPYIHQASCRGQGADCLGLVRGVWRDLFKNEPEAVPDYSSDWGEVGGRETLLEAARRWFFELPVKKAGAGDLVLFRWKAATLVRHAGILTGNGHFIHAYEKAGVVETHLGSQWERRIAAAFRFPNKHSIGTC